MELMNTAEMTAEIAVENFNNKTDYEYERDKPMLSWNHSETAFSLNAVLMPYRKEYSIKPELSLELTTGKATPDLCLYQKRKSNSAKDIIRMTEPPLLTVEILSPKQAYDDIWEKIRDIYFPAGVLSCWLLIPTSRLLQIFTPDGKILTITSGLVKDPALGIEISLEELFEDFI
jgi:Uma2 family endonuclease